MYPSTNRWSSRRIAHLARFDAPRVSIADADHSFPVGSIGDCVERNDTRPDRRDRQCMVSVVFSFWNEEAVLPELIARMRGVFDLLLECEEIAGYELIFVNDASTDRSEELLRQASAQRADIKIVNMSRNFGVSPCVMAGMCYASGDAIIYMDADLQDPPELIPDLIIKWKSDPDIEVVHTVRTARQGESRLKKMITSLGYTLLRAASSIDLPREAGDFKLLSAQIARRLVQFQERRPFMRGLIRFIGFKQEVVEYRREPRFSGQTKFPVLSPKVISNFLDSALIAFSDLPLRLASALGGLTLLAGVLCSLWALARLLFQTEAAGGSGWLAVMSVSLVVGGIQLLSIGILGRYLGSIYFESKRRPNFIVKNTEGFGPRQEHKEMPACQLIRD